MQSGEVRSLGLLALKVQTEQGSIMIIPYAKLDQEAIQLNLHEKGDSRTTFVIEIDKKKDIQETVKHIEELVINSPWCSHKTKPKVQILDETGNKIKYEISCQPNVSEGIKKLEMMLNQSFQK